MCVHPRSVSLALRKTFLEIWQLLPQQRKMLRMICISLVAGTLEQISICLPFKHLQICWWPIHPRRLSFTSQARLDNERHIKNVCIYWLLVIQSFLRQMLTQRSFQASPWLIEAFMMACAARRDRRWRVANDSMNLAFWPFGPVPL